MIKDFLTGCRAIDVQQQENDCGDGDINHGVAELCPAVIPFSPGITF